MSVFLNRSASSAHSSHHMVEHSSNHGTEHNKYIYTHTHTRTHPHTHAHTHTLPPTSSHTHTHTCVSPGSFLTILTCLWWTSPSGRPQWSVTLRQNSQSTSSLDMISKTSPSYTTREYGGRRREGMRVHRIATMLCAARNTKQNL